MRAPRCLIVRRCRGDAGSGTVASAGVVLGLLVLTALLCWVGAAVSARHQAQSAADLAALAGAYRALDGEEAACAAARLLAERSSGKLVMCQMAELDMLVAVEVETSAAGFSFGPARAQARAGPAPEQGGQGR